MCGGGRGVGGYWLPGQMVAADMYDCALKEFVKDNKKLRLENNNVY